MTLDDKKKWAKILSLWKQMFFEMFESIDLLGPNEMILSFGQKTWKNPVDRYKLFPDIFNVGDNQKT